jgi:hypothetical protein
LEPVARSWTQWLGGPRNAVLVIMATLIVVGGGRQLRRSWQARRAVRALEDSNASPEAIEAVANHGRAGLIELFRVLETAPTAPQRQAAGRALAILWAHDEMIAEEEQALVRRGFHVDWRARRRYPRSLRGSIPIVVSYGVPFLEDEGAGVGASQLEWSHRLMGTHRASHEIPSEWRPGSGQVLCSLFPEDFAGNGPHRLVLHTKARTTGLTDSWQIDLPQVPLSFEFDPKLAVDALLALPDAERGDAIRRAVRLERASTEDSSRPNFLMISDELALRDPPVVAVTTPLPCDLAHVVDLEFEGAEGSLAAGEVILSGQGVPTAGEPEIRRFPLPAESTIGSVALERPGRYRLRAVLRPDPERGWADPAIRSLWPEPVVTEWVEVEVVRR